MMKNLLRASLATAILAGAAPAMAQSQSATDQTPSQQPSAQTQNGNNIGYLTCQASSGWGFIFGSSREVRCVFATPGGHSTRYSGTITKFGVDIGYLNSAVIVWGVFAPSVATTAPVNLAGSYAGVSGSAAVGVGAGANVLVGGSAHHFMLQPVSIEGQTGLNVAAGIAALHLKLVS